MKERRASGGLTEGVLGFLKPFLSAGAWDALWEEPGSGVSGESAPWEKGGDT